MATIPRPKGHHSIVAGAAVHEAHKLIPFFEKAFNGKIGDKYTDADGKVMHAEVLIDDSVFMFSEPEAGQPQRPASLMLYVPDGKAVDTVYERALREGATKVTPPKDQFYGYRSATVMDPCGNRWNISAIIEEVSPEEMQKRLKSMGH